MVYETTEYRKKFRWNSPHKRHQIWKENWNIRKNRRLLEFRHEPILWEGNQFCNNSTSTADDDEYLPPSKLKQKHLDLIKLTKQSKTEMIDKETSSESRSPSVTRSPSPEKITCDVGVQTPNWDEFKKNNEKHVQPAQLDDLQKLSKRIKESIAYNMDVLDLVEHIIERATSSVSEKQYNVTEDHRSCSPDKRYKRFHGKSPFSLYGWANKTRETADKHTFNIKASENVFPSAMKALKKKLAEAPKLSKHLTTDIKQQPYKREGHRIINDLKNYVRGETASKWLADYDNRNRFIPRTISACHARI